MRNFYRLWVILLVISGGIALWFSGAAMPGMWKFFRLNAQVSAKVLNWQIQELSSSRFVLKADYQFDASGTTYFSHTIFERPQFLNRFAAENYMRANGSKAWEAWYRMGVPTCSSLEREFPKKQCLQALLTIGVFFYFFFARGMVQRFQNQET
ncbi:MAG: hypothetical protein WA347_00270 [Rhabdochlamydiaceae bacterium]